MVRGRNEEDQGPEAAHGMEEWRGWRNSCPSGAREQVAAAWLRAMGTPCAGNAQGVPQHARAQTHGLLSCLHCSLQALATQSLHMSPTAPLRLSHHLITCSCRGTVPVLLLVPWRDLCEVPLVSRVQTLRPAGPQQLCQTRTETSLEHGTKFHPVHKLEVLPPTATLALHLPGDSPLNPKSSQENELIRALAANAGSCCLASKAQRQDIHPRPGKAAFPLAHL